MKTRLGYLWDGKGRGGEEGGSAKQNKEILGSDGDTIYFKYGNGSMGVVVSIHQNLSSWTLWIYAAYCLSVIP